MENSFDAGEELQNSVALRNVKWLIRLLILMCVQDETNYPWPSGQALQRLSVGGHPRKALFELADDGRHRFEHPVGEFLFAQFIPDMFPRIELGGIAREAMQANVSGNPQILGSVGTGPVHNHDDEFLRMSRTYL